MSAFARFLLCFRVCTRARDVINTEEILSQMTKNPSLVRTSRRRSNKDNEKQRKNVRSMKEEVVFYSPPQKDDGFRGPKRPGK